MKLLNKIALCWRILRASDGGAMRHANRELPFIGSDEMGMHMQSNLRELVLVFSTQGHSGFSASYAVSVLEKLLRYEPVVPLTGVYSEWNEVGDGVLQNNRCGRVFKQADRFGGQAYDIDGRVFREPSGACYTSGDSFVPVVFPYTPKTEYVDVAE